LFATRHHNVTALFVIVNMVCSDENKILIKITSVEGYNARQLTTEFPDKGSALRGNVRKSWLRRTALLISYFWTSSFSLPRLRLLYIWKVVHCGFSSERIMKIVVGGLEAELEALL